jgi:hypothetical protein
MFIPPAVLVVVVLALLCFAIGSDPQKKYGPIGFGLLALAVLLYFAGPESRSLLAALGDQ